jgi:hypothetical protein
MSICKRGLGVSSTATLQANFPQGRALLEASTQNLWPLYHTQACGTIRLSVSFAQQFEATSYFSCFMLKEGEGFPLEEAHEHFFQIQSVIFVIILISFQCYYGECSGYIVVILPLLAFYFSSTYILYLVYYKELSVRFHMKGWF